MALKFPIVITIFLLLCTEVHAKNEPAENLFDRIKRLCPEKNISTFSLNDIELISHSDYKDLTPVPERMGSRLFEHSYILRNQTSKVYFYAWNTVQRDYYQFVICQQGDYGPSLVLFHFSPTGKLIWEHHLAGNFTDGTEAYVWESELPSAGQLSFTHKSYSVNQRGEYYCDSSITVLSIRKDGKLKKLQEDQFRVKTTYLRGPAVNMSLERVKTSHVLAPSGLKLRNKLNKYSKTIAVVPYGAEVTILQVSSDSYGIDWVNGNWTLVQFDTLQGYIFDGYLSTFPAPELTDSISCYYHLPDMLLSYLANHFQAVNEADTVFAKSIPGTNQTWEFVQEFEDNLTAKLNYLGNGFSAQLNIPNITIEEVYICVMGLIRNCRELEKLKEELVFVKNRQQKIHKIYDRSGYISIREGEFSTVELKFNSDCCDTDRDFSVTE